MEYIRDFNQLSRKDVSLAGGKGASLGEMTRAGLPVPPGFVILSAAFETFLARGGLEGHILSTLASITDEKAVAAVNKASEKIRSLITEATIPNEIEKAIIERFNNLGADRVAVRSSATAEDGSTAAWAGQLDSYLNITSVDLIANVKKCWASLFSHRAIAYRFDKGLTRERISMAVVVQKMVAANVSGVAFSAHPITGDTDQVVVEAACGLGEDLVAGRVTPDSYVVNKKTLLLVETRVSADEPAPPAGTASLSTTTLIANKIEQKLAEKDILDLVRLVTRIEDHWGFPVDVEWATDGDLFIIQSRPITTLPNRTAKPAYVWSNLNIAEVLPGLIPPLVKDMILGLIQPAMIKILKLPTGVPLATDIKGRLYFNVTALENALRNLLKTDELDVTALLGGAQEQAPALRQAPLLVKIKILLFGLGVFGRSFFLQKQFAQLVSEIRAFEVDYGRRIDGNDDFLELLRIEQEIFSLITGLAGRSFLLMAFPFSFYIIFSSLAKRWFDGDGTNRSHMLMGAGGHGLPEIEAFCDLWHLRDAIKERPGLAKSFLAVDDTDDAVALLKSHGDLWRLYQAFMAEHGHRCAKELDFSIPRWREDPTFIISILKNYLKASGESDPQKKRADLHDLQAQSLAKARAELPRWKFKLLNKLLKMAIEGQQKREMVKSETVKLLMPIRAAVLKIGDCLVQQGCLEERHNIFMLRLDELHALADNPETKTECLGITETRKAAYENYAQLDLPPVITDIDNIAYEATSEPVIAENSLTGIGASHGKVEGIARVINSIDEISKLNPDEILVTDHTDPGWTPVFATIKGLVTNTGGLISHAAIVAREYGLPAVVNVPNATRLLKNGQHILLDADSGKVLILAD